MYIEPRTNIRFLSGVPLDESYEHTIYFANKTAQASYFASKTKYQVPDSTYQRVNRGRCRIGVGAENLYNCNYMMFQNQSYGTKWFYAFVLSVEYISDGCTEVTFEIDPIQTYCFDWHMRQCLVERQHVRDDSIGANLMAEPVDLGDYVGNDYQETVGLNKMVLIVATGSEPDSLQGGVPVSGSVISGMYSGVKYQPFYIQNDDMSWNTSQINQANSYLEACTSAGISESVVSVFMMPEIFCENIVGNDKPIPVKYTELFVMQDAYKLDGYTPKNKKMYTYPYNALRVDNGQNSKIYKFEFFPKYNIGDNYDRSYQFEIWTQLSCAPSLLMIPYKYKGVDNNFSESMGLDAFGQCAYTIDGYRAWLAQNSIKTSYNFMQNLAGITIAVATANPILGASQLLGAGQTLSNIAQAGMLPDKVNGTQTANVLLANSHLGFYFTRLSVNRKYAKMIDDFFTKYGYAVNELRVPELDVRPHWTYVKTKKCVMECDAPADDVKKICSIFDNGITWWRNASEVGNYSLDNSPT